MLALTPNMKFCAKSLRRIKMHGDTNRQNRLIASLVDWPFVGTQSSNFWNSIQQPTMMMERKQNQSLAAYLSARETHLHRKKIYPQACRFMLPWQPCAVYPCLDVLIFHLSFEIKEILHFTAFIPLKFFLLRSGSHPFSCFSARAEIPFRLHGIFSGFSARLPGLKILARFFKMR